MNDNTDRLEKLIERYFDAATTLDEERELARLLALTRERSPLIEEAKAVMGYAAASAGRYQKPLPRRIPWRRALQVAASVAIVAGGSAIAFKLSSPRAEAAPKCIAYVDNARITDEAAVRQMALDDLRAAITCSAEVDEISRQVLSEMSLTHEEVILEVINEY